MKKTIYILITIFSLFLLAHLVYATDCTGGCANICSPITIDASGLNFITANQGCVEGATIGADHIILDCNGYTVTFWFGFFGGGGKKKE